MSDFATEYPDGVLKDLDTLFKAGSGSGTTYFSQDGQDLAQRYAPLTANKLPFNTGFIARDTGQDLTERFEARPPQADLTWEVATGTGNTATLPPHVAGDLIIVQANRSGSTTPPTLASGFTNMSSQGATNISARVGYKVAGSSAESGGTWSNAVSWMAIVVKGGCLFVDAAASQSQWPANTMAAPGKNIGLHTAFLYDTATPFPDDTVLQNGAVGSYVCYAGYTGLVASLPAASVGGGAYRVAFTFEMQPLQPFVPELEANAVVLNEAGGSCPVPPHSVGDLIIIAAGRRDSPAPAIPGGASLLPLINSGSQLYVNGTLAYKVATSSAETSGVWGADVTTLMAIVVKGCDGVGAKQFAWYENTGLGSKITYPALTLQKPGQSGILTVGFSNNQSGDNALVGPTSLQVLENLANQSQAVRADGSTSLFSSWSAVTITAPSNVNVGFSLELFVTGAPKPVDGTITLGTQADAYGYNNGYWVGGPIGAWGGNPSNLNGLLYWTDGTDETWLRIGNGQYSTYTSLTLSLNGGPTATLTWNQAGGYYVVAGDPLGLSTAPQGTPLTLVSTGVTLLSNTPVSLPSDYAAPTAPDPGTFSTRQINYGGKIL